MRPRQATLIVALLAGVFFFAPTMAFLAGTRAKPIENRPLVGFPSLDRGWDIFDSITQWSTDHLPGRSSAVRFNSRLTERVFGEPPVIVGAGGPVGAGQTGDLAGGTTRPATGNSASKVVEGSDGWLYLTQDFDFACAPQMRIADIKRGLVRLDSILRSSGRRFLFVVPPDKSTFEANHVPTDYPRKQCAEEERRQRTGALRSLDLASFVDVEAALQDRQTRERAAVYLPQDTHWNDGGEVTYATTLARALNPKLLEHTRATREPDAQAVGDLTVFTGDPIKSNIPVWTLHRDGVQPGRASLKHLFPNGDLKRELQRGSGKALLHPGRTVLYGDSFTGVSAAKVVPFFADLTRPPQLNFAAEAGRLAESERMLIDLIVKSKTFIYERVARGFWGIRRGNLLRRSFLNKLDAELAR